MTTNPSDLKERLRAEEQLAWDRKDSDAATFFRDIRQTLERKDEALRKTSDAIKRARNMVPDEDDGLAAQLFAFHLNAADMIARAALGGDSDT